MPMLTMLTQDGSYLLDSQDESNKPRNKTRPLIDRSRHRHQHVPISRCVPPYNFSKIPVLMPHIPPAFCVGVCLPSHRYSRALPPAHSLKPTPFSPSAMIGIHALIRAPLGDILRGLCRPGVISVRFALCSVLIPLLSLIPVPRVSSQPIPLFTGASGFVIPFVICAHAGMHAWTLKCSWSLLHDLFNLCNSAHHLSHPAQIAQPVFENPRTARSRDDVALPMTTATLPRDEEDDSILGRSVRDA
jgi:hypothetical protein